MKIGARVIKTGIAVAITMFICEVLELEPAFFGAVSAVINIQPSIFLTLKEARNQIFVHVLGVGAGFLFGYFIGVNPLSAGLIVILLIPLLSRLKLNNGITMGIVAALFVLSASTEEFMAHALARTGVIFAGLGSAMFVNVFLWPPRYGEMLREKLRQSNEAAVLYFCRAVQEYINLDTSEPCPDAGERERVDRLNGEVRKLLELLSRETGGVGAVAADRLARPGRKAARIQRVDRQQGEPYFRSPADEAGAPAAVGGSADQRRVQGDSRFVGKRLHDGCQAERQTADGDHRQRHGGAGGDQRELLGKADGGGRAVAAAAYRQLLSARSPRSGGYRERNQVGGPGRPRRCWRKAWQTDGSRRPPTANGPRSQGERGFLRLLSDFFFAAATRLDKRPGGKLCKIVA